MSGGRRPLTAARRVKINNENQSWDACEKAAAVLDEDTLMSLLENRETARAEDMMRQAVVYACERFEEMYGKTAS